MTIREATPADAPACADVYGDAVRAAGPRRYSAEQTAAWAGWADDPDAFGRLLLKGRAFVAEDERGAAGFVTLEPDGRVGMLYVQGDRQRLGRRRRPDAAGSTPKRARSVSRCSSPPGSPSSRWRPWSGRACRSSGTGSNGGSEAVPRV